MTVHLHVVKGCSPAPLANYLKALGILRLVGEQADEQARGWWEGETFCLLTKLSRTELEAFFLKRYEPTPLLSPWNKGCGFFKPNDPGLAPLEQSQAPRFERFRRGVAEARHLLDAVAQADAVIRAIKARTKTNKTFQSGDQRQLLECSDTYRGCLDQLQTQLDKPDLAAEKRADIDLDMATIQSLVLAADKPPQRAEAEALKASSGYKRVLAAAERRFKSLKATLLPDCRRLWRGPHAEWLSAAVVLDEEGNPEWPSLLGTGGNDGNLDFTNNFMQQLGSLFDLAAASGGPTTAARELLDNALWMDPANKLTCAAVGQYQPGSAGGANSSTGFASGNLVNPWDFVFMMEGSLLFSSRATRRLDPSALSRASAPFAVRPHAAGFATPGSEKAQRGEQWLPLWKQPATLPDIGAMYGEARVQLNRQTANRPVDMARAISRLGVARGIDAFVRYGYLERNGQSTLAVPLGRVPVRHHPRAYLIDDLAGWMDRVQRRSRDKHAPARLLHAERRLADAVFAALTHDYTPDRWQAILEGATAIESLQASGTAIEAGPLPPLRPEWAAAVDDGSPEVRLALALGSAAAGYTREGRPIDPVRHHWLPLERGAQRFKTAEKRLVNDPRVVLSARDPIRDLSALIDRRLVEAGMKGQRRSRLVAARGCGARLDDLARFLSGALDLDKLLGLARAFTAIKWDQWSTENCLRATSSAEFPEEAWLAIRLACLPWPLTRDKDIPADPRIVRLLLGGESSRAIEIARSRLCSVGLRPPLQAGVTDLMSARLWAAALAFPIHRGSALRAAIILDPSTKGLLYA
jgi:CRISPR-associated protein Csx17